MGIILYVLLQLYRLTKLRVSGFKEFTQGYVDIKCIVGIIPICLNVNLNPGLCNSRVCLTLILNSVCSCVMTRVTLCDNSAWVTDSQRKMKPSVQFLLWL